MLSRYEAPDSDETSDSCGSDENGDESGESDDSSSSSCSSASTLRVANKMRNLNLNQVLSMDTGNDADESQSALNGKSHERIKQALKKPCCKQRCKRHLNFKMVLSFCVAFWSLSKSGQDCLLLGFKREKHHSKDVLSEENLYPKTKVPNSKTQDH